MFDLALTRNGESMSTYETLMLMLAFATLVLRIIDSKENKNNHLPYFSE